MSITLSKTGLTSVTLPDPLLPYTERSERRYNATFMTEGSVRYVYDKGAHEYVWMIALFVTTESQVTNLQNFFHGTGGMRDTFTMTIASIDTKHNGTFAVRFAEDTLEDKVVKRFGGWAVTLQLLEQSES